MNQQEQILETLETIKTLLLVDNNKKSKILTICTFCTKSFELRKDIYKNKLRSGKNKFYCSRTCSSKDLPNKYDVFFWCGNCKWIPKNEAITKLKGTIIEYQKHNYELKHNRFYCPKCKERLIRKNPKNKEKKRI